MKEVYQLSIKKVYNLYHTSFDGLSKNDVKMLRNKNGLNVLVEQNKVTKLDLFFKQFKNVMIILLFVVGFLSLFYAIVGSGDYLEAFVILGTGVLNCFMGFFQESKAVDALSKLKKYSSSYVTVKRGGKYQDIDSKNLVVGDFIVLEAGDKIPADARIIESYFAKTDESLLTGESLFVDKSEGVISQDTILAKRYNMVYSGTLLVTGYVEAIVVATGMDTELGKIAGSLAGSKEPLTPLQVKVEKVSKFITMIAIFLVAIVLIYSIVNNYSFLSIVMLCISMIVASVPECLPVAITATLTIGVKQMAKKKTIVRNMAAIETLGSTEIICIDKTGTLTKNKMEVTDIYVDLNDILVSKVLDYPSLAEIMFLCNTATKNKDNSYSGDSVDVALKNCLSNYKLTNYTRLVELPFDSNRKMMSSVYKYNNEIKMYSKGSLESLIEKCNRILLNGKVVRFSKELKKKFLAKEEEMSLSGLKVIAFAYKKLNGELKENDYLGEENKLVMVGLIGLKDPVRDNIVEAIKNCKSAHIMPIMLTGDNLQTATKIAMEVGICKSKDECINACDLDGCSSKEWEELVMKHRVFARVSPENKLEIIKFYQKKGYVVAMSGDGVNDAPAIKEANVGIGMGNIGTDVTKDVADIILLDDSFETIVTAVNEGRRIYDNVITNILYNLSSNFTEILIILIGMFTNNVLISAIHVLYIDLVADTIPSIMLAFEGPSKDVMKRKPTGLNKKIFTPFFLAFLIVSVIFETLISFIVYKIFAGDGLLVAQTLTLLSIIINEFVFAYNCRSVKECIRDRGYFSNKYLNLGIFFLLIVQLIVFLTPLGRLFGLKMISVMQFMFVFGINVLSFLGIEFIKPILVKMFADE